MAVSKKEKEPMQYLLGLEQARKALDSLIFRVSDIEVNNLTRMDCFELGDIVADLNSRIAKTTEATDKVLKGKKRF